LRLSQWHSCCSLLPRFDTDSSDGNCPISEDSGPNTGVLLGCRSFVELFQWVLVPEETDASSFAPMLSATPNETNSNVAF